MSCRIDAKRTLVFYLKLCLEKAGGEWSSDNQVEVEGIVDDILDAVRHEMSVSAEVQWEGVDS